MRNIPINIFCLRRIDSTDETQTAQTKYRHHRRKTNDALTAQTKIMMNNVIFWQLVHASPLHASLPLPFSSDIFFLNALLLSYSLSKHQPHRNVYQMHPFNANPLAFLTLFLGFPEISPFFIYVVAQNIVKDCRN